MAVVEEKETKAISPAVQFRKTAIVMAQSLLKDWVGEERAREATGRIAAAISSSAAASKDPNEFYRCTPQSVATCVAVAALTGIMPSTGAAALAYVVPQRPRKDEDPQLSYMLSHRGLNALAQRCGQTMIAIPISKRDKIEDNGDGEVTIVDRDIDNPPTSYDDLRGVVVIVKRLDTAMVITRGWVPKSLINARKEVSRSAKSSYSPWTTWPVEMSMKCAMHYAVTRGWCVIDDTEAVRALSVDTESDFDSGTIEGSVSAKRIAANESLADQLERRAGIEQKSETTDYTVLLDGYRERLNKAVSMSALVSLSDAIRGDRLLPTNEAEILLTEVNDRLDTLENESVD